MPLTEKWTKTSYSAPNGTNCVEARRAANGAQVRDSQDPSGPVLGFGPGAWSLFNTEIKTGRLAVGTDQA